MDLHQSIKQLDRSFKLYSNKLAKLGIFTVENLLYHIPSRYEDLSNIRKIKGLRIGEVITIKGTIISVKNEYRSRSFSMQKILIRDISGEIELRFFNQPYLVRNLSIGKNISASGTVEFYGKVKCIAVKEYEVLEKENSETVHTGRLVPIYPLTYGVSSKWLRNKIYNFLYKEKVEIPEFLPEKILLSHNLLLVNEAIKKAHFPKNFNEVSNAIKRLSYEELFLLQLSALVRRQEWEKKNEAKEFHVLKYKEKINEFFKKLPFTLTNAQVKALDEIYADLASKTPMNRLLEGDVGSGKTVVAAVAMYIAILNGCKALFMAPTEILANQHYSVLTKLLTPLGINVKLITSSTKKQLKRELNNNTKSAPNTSFDIAVGTHALLHTELSLSNLGLVVIDEQQRFGVEQRAKLRSFKTSPHFLTMTATPIPRTVFLTLYGDLSLSVLDELPKGRVKVRTWLVPNEKREKGYEWIKEKIVQTDENGNRNQVFIICPFIEESESATTVKAATKEYERLSREIFKDFSVGLLHGKMKTKEKDNVLEDFSKGKYDILVATPVVEVGIDIPNATIMVIEAAERFGLSQLHQLRGRVGRRKRESFCLLYTSSEADKTRDRLKSLEKIYVGAELAELDLKMRGPGEIYGTEQHGSHKLKIASFSDFELILKTKRDAEKIFEEIDNFPKLKEKIEEVNIKQIKPD